MLHLWLHRLVFKLWKNFVWVLSSLNQCNFPSRRSLRSMSCYFVVSLCVYICVRVAESFRQIHSATTLQLVVEFPLGRRCGWLALCVFLSVCVCVCVRERKGERALLPPHTLVQLLSSHTSDSDLALLPTAHWALPSATFSPLSLSLCPYLLLLRRPVWWYFHTSSVVSHGVCPNLTDSLFCGLVEDRKRFQSSHRKCCCSQGQCRCWYTQYYRQANDC